MPGGDGADLVAAAGADLEGDAPRHVDAADHALLEFLDAFANFGAGAALGAVLDDAVVLAGRLDHLAALEEVVRARLLDVDVLAGLAGPDGFQGVPMVGSGQGHGVDRLVVQQPPLVDLGLRAFARAFLDLGGGLLQAVFVAVGKGGNLDVFGCQLEQRAAVRHAPAAAQPDDGHAEAAVGAGGGAERRGGQGDRGGGLEESAAVGLVHGGSPRAGIESAITRRQLSAPRRGGQRVGAPRAAKQGGENVAPIRQPRAARRTYSVLGDAGQQSEIRASS